MRLRRALIFAPDLARAKDFYCGVLGLGLREEAAGHLVLSAGAGGGRDDGWTLLVFRCRRGGRVGDYADEARSVLVFEVESLDRAMGELAGKGVAFLHSQPGQNQFGRYAAFTDPFDNVHEIFEPAAA